MYKNLKISLCMPCRNEAKHLKKVIAQVPDIVDEIIIVSNRSTDNTVEVARKLRAVVVEDNRVVHGVGYGFAHMTAIDRARGDIIVGMDADGTYPIRDIEKMIKVMIDDNIDFMSGNRFGHDNSSKTAPKLRFGVWLLGIEARLLYRVKINDILSGMWVFRRQIKEKIGLTMGDWNLSPQIKINAFTNDGIKAIEYPITQRKRFGKTHQQYFKTGFSHAFWIFKNRLN